VWWGLRSRHTGPYRGLVAVFLRRQLISIVCLAVAGLIGVAAIIDHRNKQARIDRAELAEWYCSHDGTRCGGPSSEKIEEHWNEREGGYEVVVAELSGFALVRFVYRLARP
jgi:hypothetical protein